MMLAILGNIPSAFSQDAEPANRIFLIGNSLTWDTLPGLLDGDVQWHVDCGKNLKYIHDNPSRPCVKTSTTWPRALKAKQYDALIVQPHFGTTLDEDVAVISHWLEMQPGAKLVIHTGWNRQNDFESTYHAEVVNSAMVHAPKYFEMLRGRLTDKFPDREMRTTGAIDILDEIWHDIEKDRAPFHNFGELYRDSIHMTTQVGRYLMHNLMRIALDQPLSSQGFQIDATHQHYLDHKLKSAAEKLRNLDGRDS